MTRLMVAAVVPSSSASVPSRTGPDCSIRDRADDWEGVMSEAGPGPELPLDPEQGHPEVRGLLDRLRPARPDRLGRPHRSPLGHRSPLYHRRHGPV